MSETPFERLHGAASAYRQSCILSAAAELDVFTVILANGNALGAGALAGRLKADARGLAVLLDALAAMEYLLKTGLEEQAVYAVPEQFQEYLDSRTPGSFVPMLRHIANIQRHWVQLARVVKTGQPSSSPPSILGAEEDDRSFILAMNAIGRTLAQTVLASLLQSGVLSFPRPDIRFIDIGGASGTYTLAFLRALPQASGIIFDRPVGIDAASQRFRGTEFASRIRLVAGDFYKDELPGACDFAWISAIIHQMGRAESRELYCKAFKALVPGGKVAVRDFIMNADRTSPREGAFFGLNMLVNTPQGRVYTFDEVKEDLESAGFTQVSFAVPAPSMCAVVAAFKP